MTARTVKIFGQGFGSTSAEISVTLNGNSIYTGAVPTLDQPVYSLPDPDLVSTVPELCNFEIDMDASGNIPMTCTVLSGTVIFAQILANYCTIANTNPVIGTGPDGFRSICGLNADARSNVNIDGTPKPIDYTTIVGPVGTSWFVLDSGSVLTYDLNVLAGTANVAPPTP